MSLWCISGFIYSSNAGTDEMDNTNSEISPEAKPYDLANEQKILSAEQQEQDAYQSKQGEIKSRIDSLQTEAASKLADAKSAHEAVESLRSNFLYTKSILKDPWREIYGEKKFVMAVGSSFIKFNGQILEATADGIRVFGQFGESTNSEYFVVNFPYDFKAGESVDPTKTYVALEDGTFSYVSEDGYAKSLSKLNYGKPCARPNNADAVEQSALQSQVSAAEQNAKAEDEIATAAQKRLQDSSDEIIAVRKEAAEKMRSAIYQALKYDMTYADKGNLEALSRMEARYRDGDGVDIDTNEAAQYARKYEANFQTEATQITEKDRLIEQEAAKQKFLRNLFLADKYASVECILYVENCYRNGVGTEKDLSKADEYHAKAVSLGALDQPNRSPLVK